MTLTSQGMWYKLIFDNTKHWILNACDKTDWTQMVRNKCPRTGMLRSVTLQSNSYVGVFAWYRPLFSSESPDSGTVCWNPFLGFLPWVKQLRFAFVTLASWRHQVKALCSLLRRRSVLKTMRAGYVGGHIAAPYITHATPFASVRQYTFASSVILATGLAAGWADYRVSILGGGKKFFSPQKRPDWPWGPPTVLPNGGLAREAPLLTSCYTTEV
jgi:hypothetical protein